MTALDRLAEGEGMVVLLSFVLPSLVAHQKEVQDGSNS